MPHFILEFSDNILEKFEARPFFEKVHALAMEFNTFSLADIKSRAIRHTQYYLGDGKANNAFAYLHVALLSGRPVELRRKLGEGLLHLMALEFRASLEKLNLSMTCEIREINSETHLKFTKTSA